MEHRNGAAGTLDRIERNVAGLRDDDDITLSWNGIRFGSHRRATDQDHIS
jgi:hypothetical protein